MGASPPDRLHRQNAFDAYLALEVAPFVRNRTVLGRRWELPAAASAATMPINFALRHPDLVTYAVSMSGAFDIPKRFLDGYYNDDAYFNGPLDYLPNLNGWHWILPAELLCSGGRQSRSSVRPERETGTLVRDQGDSPPHGCLGRLRSRLALVASDGSEVLRLT